MFWRENMEGNAYTTYFIIALIIIGALLAAFGTEPPQERALASNAAIYSGR